MSVISLFCDIIAQSGKVTAGFYAGDTEFFELIKHGYLRAAGVATSVVCNDCDAPHSASVVYENDVYGYYCRDLGFVELDASQLTTYLPNYQSLISQLAELFECRQRKPSSLYSETWRIGAIDTPSATIMLYFQPSLETEDDLRNLQNALGRESRSDWRLVVTCQGTLPMAGVVAVRLDDLVELETNTGTLQSIANPASLIGAPKNNHGGRPSQHGPAISKIIEERIANGQALKGRNKEADAVLSHFVQRNPNQNVPSRSSVREYVTKIRSEQ